MKKVLFTLFMLASSIAAIACPVCKKQQPKILQGITHGAGPQGPEDYIIIWATVAIVLVTLFFSVKWLIKPGEKSADHIKHFILNVE